MDSTPHSLKSRSMFWAFCTPNSVHLVIKKSARGLATFAFLLHNSPVKETSHTGLSNFVLSPSCFSFPCNSAPRVRQVLSLLAPLCWIVFLVVLHRLEGGKALRLSLIPHFARKLYTRVQSSSLPKVRWCLVSQNHCPVFIYFLRISWKRQGRI